MALSCALCFSGAQVPHNEQMVHAVIILKYNCRPFTPSQNCVLFFPGAQGADRASRTGPEAADGRREGGRRRHDTARGVHQRAGETGG